MALIDSISNGTCYWKAGKKAASNFIPCGNAFDENINYPCCNVGDKCVGSFSCYHSDGDITYLAGCTDSEYTDETCPYKGAYRDQQWVGLVNCKGFPGHTDKEWAGCLEDDGKTVVEFPALCNCRDKTALFTEAPVLPDVAFLPSTISGVISWPNGFHGTVPPVSIPKTTGPTTTMPLTSKTTMSTATTISDNSASTGTHNTGAPAPPTNQQESKGLATSTKAGIGTGAGIAGILLVGCFVVIAMLYRRRKKQQEPSAEAMLPSPSNDNHDTNDDDRNNHGGPMHPHSGGAMTSAPWTGFKAELAADSPTSSQRPESTATTAAHPTNAHQWVAYNPHHHGDHAFRNSNVSNPTSPRSMGSTNSAMSVSPQHTGHEFGQAGGKDEGPGTGRMPPIAEMQG